MSFVWSYTSSLLLWRWGTPFLNIIHRSNQLSTLFNSNSLLLSLPDSREKNTARTRRYLWNHSCIYGFGKASCRCGGNGASRHRFSPCTAVASSLVISLTHRWIARQRKMDWLAARREPSEAEMDYWTCSFISFFFFFQTFLFIFGCWKRAIKIQRWELPVALPGQFLSYYIHMYVRYTRVEIKCIYEQGEQVHGKVC